MNLPVYRRPGKVGQVPDLPWAGASAFPTLSHPPAAGLPPSAVYTGFETRMDLATPLTYVKGIGPARAALLEAKGLATVEDLLGYVPFRYEDRSNMKTIAQLAPGEMATVIATR